MKRFEIIYTFGQRLRLAFGFVVLLFALSVSSAFAASAQEPAWPYALPSAVKTGFDKGDHATVSTMFGQSVELRLPGTSGIFSRKQAEMILGEFFASHKGMKLFVDHEETVGGSTLTIGNAHLGGQTMRVYILSQNEGGTCRIKQFRVEEMKND